MTAAANTTLPVKDATGTTATMGALTDPNNASAKVPKSFHDEALNNKATFGAGASLFTLPAAPTDVVEIFGSDTKTVRIKRIVVSGRATTVAQWPLSLIRRVAAITGGVAVTPVITKFDTGGAAASGGVRHFTTLGTLKAANPASSTGIIHDLTLTAPASAAQPAVFDFATRQDKAFVLRGAADCLVINLGGGALVAGEVLTYYVEWEEDDS